MHIKILSLFQKLVWNIVLANRIPAQNPVNIMKYSQACNFSRNSNYKYSYLLKKWLFNHRSGELSIQFSLNQK